MDIFKNRVSDNRLVVKPTGRIDINTAAEFGCEVNDELDDVTDLILDFEEIVYISSMGLRVLLELQKRMNTQGSMKLLNVKPEVMEVFTMTGFSNILTIV